MTDTVARRLLDLVEDLVRRAATREDVGRLEERLDRVERIVTNGLSEQVTSTRRLVDELGKRVRQLDTVTVGKPDALESPGLWVRLTPTKGWLAAAILVLLLLLNLTGVEVGDLLALLKEVT